MEYLRSFAKSVLSSYNWYQPELSFSRCMMKYARKTYPELMRNLRVPNIGMLGRNMFAAVSEYVINVVNGPQYEEILLEQERIGAKVEQILRPWPEKMSHSRARLQRQSAIARQQPRSDSTLEQPNQNSSTISVLTEDAMTDSNWEDERTQLEDQLLEGEELRRNRFNAMKANEQRHDKGKRSINEEPSRFIGPRQFPSYEPLVQQEPVNEDEDMNLANKPPEEIVEDLFDWEPVILEGIGIDPKSIEKDSPTYCGKEYVFSFIRRVISDFVMA